MCTSAHACTHVCLCVCAFSLCRNERKEDLWFINNLPLPIGSTIFIVWSGLRVESFWYQQRHRGWHCPYSLRVLRELSTGFPITPIKMFWLATCYSLWNGGLGLVVKSVLHSCRGPEFDSSQRYQEVHNHLSSSRWSCTLIASSGLWRYLNSWVHSYSPPHSQIHV